MINEHSVSVSNMVSLKDRGGNPVGFQGVDHVNVTSALSDDNDVAGGPGYIYVGDAANVNLMLAESDTALVYAFPQAGIYPLLVKRVLSTNTTPAVNIYIIR